MSSRPHFSKNEMISWPHGIQGPQRADLDLCTTLIGSRTAGISIRDLGLSSHAPSKNASHASEASQDEPVPLAATLELQELPYLGFHGLTDERIDNY